jgi:uncharacterized RDD family membrane protein YckC
MVAQGQLYARAAPRLQAWLRDGLVQVGIVTICLTAAVMLGTPMATRAIVICAMATILFYEPVCIAVAGGTIGHLSMNLRIVRADNFGRVSFGRALLRTVVKAVVGIWVFMAIYFTRRSQGLHDLAAGTVVVPRKMAAAPQRGFAVDRVAVFLLLALPAVAGAQALTADARAKAEQIWNRYVALEAAFDPAVADLYSDDAVIRNRRTYPTGEVRETTVPAARVRVACARFSTLKNYTSPISVLVGPGPTGAWLIFEEISESRP